MHATSSKPRRFAAVAQLREETGRVASHIVARAHAARRLGMTAEACRSRALDLERQADRAGGLLFGQAVETFRAAAAENRLMADALDAIDAGMGLQ